MPRVTPTLHNSQLGVAQTIHSHDADTSHIHKHTYMILLV